MNCRTTSLNLDEGLLTRLDVCAHEAGVSRSALANQFLAQALAEHQNVLALAYAHFDRLRNPAPLAMATAGADGEAAVGSTASPS